MELRNAGTDGNGLVEQRAGLSSFSIKPRTRRLLVGAVTCAALLLAVRLTALIPEIQDSLGREISRAVYRGSTGGVVFFLIVGTNPNHLVHGNMPAIHVAAEMKEEGILRLLLAVGTDPNLKAKFDITPLWCAQNAKADETAKILIEAGGYAYISAEAP